MKKKKKNQSNINPPIPPQIRKEKVKTPFLLLFSPPTLTVFVQNKRA